MQSKTSREKTWTCVASLQYAAAEKYSTLAGIHEHGVDRCAKSVVFIVTRSADLPFASKNVIVVSAAIMHGGTEKALNKCL